MFSCQSHSALSYQAEEKTVKKNHSDSIVGCHTFLGHQFKIEPPSCFGKLSRQEQEITVMPAGARADILERRRCSVTSEPVIAFSGSFNEITACIWVGLIGGKMEDLEIYFLLGSFLKMYIEESWLPVVASLDDSSLLSQTIKKANSVIICYTVHALCSISLASSCTMTYVFK